jgi:hypothetical protein
MWYQDLGTAQFKKFQTSAEIPFEKTKPPGPSYKNEKSKVESD